MLRRQRRSSGSSLPLLLLLLFLLVVVTCLGVTAPLASAQPDDGDDDALSYENDDGAQEARSSPPPSTPSIEDLAPGAVVSTLRGSPRWKVLPDLFVRRTALVDCDAGQVREERVRGREGERENREGIQTATWAVFPLNLDPYKKKKKKT